MVGTSNKSIPEMASEETAVLNGQKLQVFNKQPIRAGGAIKVEGRHDVRHDAPHVWCGHPTWILPWKILWMEEILHQLETVSNYETL